MLDGRDRWATFLRAKAQRPVIDPYAAFQPFNEGTRTLVRLLPALRERLQPGDRVLDLWSRTGWSAAQAAALFPEQRVTTMLDEGGLLGRRGAAFWLDDVDVERVFAGFAHGLPFPDDHFALVVGYDVLHHDLGLVAECERVCTGPVLLEHIHTSGGHTDYERGGDHPDPHDLPGIVLPERGTFDADVVEHQPDSGEPNVAIVLGVSAGTALGPRVLPGHAGSRILRNPVADDVAWTEEIRRRHPLIVPRGELDRTDRLLLYQGDHGATVAEAAKAADLDVAEALRHLHRLQDREFLHLRDVPRRIVELQRYYVAQEPPIEASSLAELWDLAVRRFGDREALHWTEDGSRFTYADADEVVALIAGWLRDRPGDVVLEPDPDPLFVLTCHAAWRLGRVVVVPSPADRRPRLHLDPDAIASATPWTERAPVGPDDDALILFTSGTTAAAKGVVLSHRSLLWSSHRLDLGVGLTGEDCMLVTASPRAMSGLRNLVLVPLHSGASVVLGPDPLTVLRKAKVSVLSTVPSVIDALATSPRMERDLRALRTVLSTGASLRHDTLFGRDVCDYYGLTETGGICTFRRPGQSGVGAPCDAVIELVDGEVWVHSEGRMTRYESGGSRVVGGWVPTGDLGGFVDGSLHLLGRRDRMIVDRFGENLHPELVESLVPVRIAVEDGRLIGITEADPAELERTIRDRLGPSYVPQEWRRC